MDIIFVITMILMTAIICKMYYSCSMCHSKFIHSDYMSNGRIRFRKKGTNMPVCRRCAILHPDKVD